MKKVKVHPQTHCIVCNRPSKMVLCKACLKKHKK